MKPHRDAASLAASLTAAARKPVPLPGESSAPIVPPEPANTPPEQPRPEKQQQPAAAKAAVSKKGARPKLVSETVQVTLRPQKELLRRYTDAAAERTKAEGKVYSAQEIMLEVLERGRP